jgi:hypothetical protein
MVSIRTVSSPKASQHSCPVAWQRWVQGSTCVRNRGPRPLRAPLRTLLHFYYLIPKANRRQIQCRSMLPIQNRMDIECESCQWWYCSCVAPWGQAGAMTPGRIFAFEIRGAKISPLDNFGAVAIQARSQEGGHAGGSAPLEIFWPPWKKITDNVKYNRPYQYPPPLELPWPPWPFRLATGLSVAIRIRGDSSLHPGAGTLATPLYWCSLVQINKLGNFLCFLLLFVMFLS